MGIHRVFVYGTLKQGYGNHHRLTGAKFLGKAVSVGANYRLYELGVPFLTEVEANDASKFNGAITGEVYEANDDQLARCDRLEGHPFSYCREEREFDVSARGVGRVKAWVYLWRHERSVRDLVKPVDGLITYDLNGKRKIA